MRVRLSALSALAIVLMLALGGCGQATTAMLHQVHDFSAYGGQAPGTPKATSTGPDAQALWDKHLTAYDSCKSTHMVGTVTANNEVSQINVAGTCDGSNGKLQLTTGLQVLEIIVVAGTFYAKANAAFWKASGQPQATIEAIGSRYMSTADPKLAALTTKGILGALKSDIAASGKDVTVEETTMGGQAAYKLVHGARTSATPVSVWVTVKATTILRISFEGGGSGADLTFSEWDAVAPFVAPPASQVIKG